MNGVIQDIENTFSPSLGEIANEKKLKLAIKELINSCGKSDIKVDKNQIEKMIIQLRHKYKVSIGKNDIRYIYEKYYNDIKLNTIFSRFMIKKACRSLSGVLVCTVVLKPSKFSCPKKCSYCPTETDLNGNPTQPKSYLSSEPAMLRALQYNFDVKGQIWDRLDCYVKTGNIQTSSSEEVSYKLEIILSGGTWESYPYEYRNQVMNEIYYASNTFNTATSTGSIFKQNNRDNSQSFSDLQSKKGENREIQSIEDEIKTNETSKFRVIGMTIETRPDFITKTSIRDYCRWGVTRVQIGVQHYDDEILKKINRECYTKDTIKAIRLLKSCGFKIVVHLMPDLPGSSPELDRWMFYQALRNADLQFDDVKIYPTAVCQSNNPNLIVQSDISDWYRDGKYTPYSENNLKDLIDVLKEYKTQIQPWIRIQRLVRDIPKQSINVGYDRISNLRQVIHDEMKKEGLRCRCIRCMEIREDDEKMNDAKLVVREYEASQGDEYFITFESYDWKWYSFGFLKYIWFLFTFFITFLFMNKLTYFSGDYESYDGLIGFCRLRLDKNPGCGFIKELENCALIREVHVYGHSLGVKSSDEVNSTQHKGFGRKLVKVAENIAKSKGYSKIAIIAGVGTREYYKNKCGYQLEGTYMVKYI